MGDLSHRYIRLKKKYILRLVFVILALSGGLVQNVHGQSTFMRSCECEYITPDGKCAYTLYLPLNSQTSSGGDMCAKESDSASVTNNTATIKDHTLQLQSLENDLDNMEGNVSELSHLTLTNAQVLIDLQSKVIALQHVIITNDSYWSDQTPGDNIDQDANHAATEAQLSAITNDLNNQQNQINSLTDTVNALSQSLSTLTTELDNAKASLDSVQAYVDRLGSSNEVTVLQLDTHSSEINQLTSSIDSYKLNGALCNTKGLLVDGQTKYIPDSQINASSIYNTDHAAGRIRLSATANEGTLKGSWCPREPNTDYEWIQFDLGTPKTIYGLVTLSREDYGQWVTKYKIQYADEWMGDEGWTTYTDVLGSELEFAGNTIMNIPVTNMLWQPITAKYIRFVPLEAHNNSNKCMRADVIGCIDIN